MELNAKLWLDVADRLPVKDLIRLTKTNKTLHNLVLSYEHSIAVYKIRDLKPQPPTYILTGDGCEVTAVAAYSLRGVLELQHRCTRIDELLDADFLNISGNVSICLRPESVTRLRLGLRAALHNIEHLRDCCAVVLRSDSAATRPDPASIRAVHRAIHARRLDTLRSMSTVDLCFLSLLSELVVAGYTRGHEEKYAMNTARREHLCAFAEAVLRRGSSVISQYVAIKDNEKMRDAFPKKNLRQELTDMRTWEWGRVGLDFVEQETSTEIRHVRIQPEAQPGLHGIMKAELRKRLLHGDGHRGFAREVDNVISKEIGQRFEFH